MQRQRRPGAERGVPQLPRCPQGHAHRSQTAAGRKQTGEGAPPAGMALHTLAWGTCHTPRPRSSPTPGWHHLLGTHLPQQGGARVMHCCRAPGRMASPHTWQQAGLTHLVLGQQRAAGWRQGPQARRSRTSEGAAKRASSSAGSTGGGFPGPSGLRKLRPKPRRLRKRLKQQQRQPCPQQVGHGPLGPPQPHQAARRQQPKGEPAARQRPPAVRAGSSAGCQLGLAPQRLLLPRAWGRHRAQRRTVVGR